MNKYFMKSKSFGLTEIDAESKIDAINKIQWDFANSGIRTLVIKTYKLTSTKEAKVKTDY